MNWKILQLIGFFLALIFDGFHSKKLKVLQKLENLSLKSSNGVIYFTDSTYPLLQRKRKTLSYGILLLGTTSNPNHQCPSCVHAEEHFIKCAQAYQSTKMYLPSTHVPLFFGIMEYTENEKFYTEAKVDSVPSFFYTTNTLQSFQRQPLLTSEIHILNTIEQLHNVTLHPLVPTKQYMTQSAILTVVIALIGSISVFNMEFFVSIHRNKNLWFFVSMSIYLFSIAGGAYCIIRKAAWLPPSDPNHRALISESGNQFVFEGLLVSMIHLCFVISIILLIHFRKKTAQITQDDPMFSRFLNYTIYWIAMNLAFALSIFFMSRLYKVYVGKQKWNKLEDAIPSSINNILWGKGRYSKRYATLNILVRAIRKFLKISKKWLLNYKTWNGFVKYLTKQLKIKL